MSTKNLREEFADALEGLKHIRAKDNSPEEIERARAQLEEQRKKVFESRQRLLDNSAEYREELQGNMELARSRMPPQQARHGNLRFSTGIPPYAPVIHPHIIEDELVWVCLRCGTQNVNYEMIKGRQKQRRFVKRYAEMMEALGMSLDLKEAKRIVKRGVPYCIMCSQREKRDIYMVKRPLKEVQEIKEEVHERKIKANG